MRHHARDCRNSPRQKSAGPARRGYYPPDHQPCKGGHVLQRAVPGAGGTGAGPVRRQAAVLPLLAAKMAPGGVVLCETEREADLPEQAGALTLVKQYNYGKIKVSRYERGEEV